MSLTVAHLLALLAPRHAQKKRGDRVAALTVVHQEFAGRRGAPAHSRKSVPGQHGALDEHRDKESHFAQEDLAPRALPQFGHMEVFRA